MDSDEGQVIKFVHLTHFNWVNGWGLTLSIAVILIYINIVYNASNLHRHALSTWKEWWKRNAKPVFIFWNKKVREKNCSWLQIWSWDSFLNLNSHWMAPQEGRKTQCDRKRSEGWLLKPRAGVTETVMSWHDLPWFLGQA